METWLLGNRDDVIHNVLGAIGPTDWLEVTTGFFHGGSYDGIDNAYGITGPLFQLKALAHEAKPGALPGVAFTVGTLTPFGSGWLTPEETGVFGYTAVTQSLFNDDLLLHLNLGGTSWEMFTAGFGFQAHTIERLYAVAEIYRGDPYDPAITGGASQVGFRYILNENIQFDGTLGSTIADNPDRWWTFGIRMVSDALW